MALHTTLNLLREHGACKKGYRKLLRYLNDNAYVFGLDTPIPLETVLASNGLADALWCLRATLPEEAAERHKIAHLFLYDCVEASTAAKAVGFAGNEGIVWAAWAANAVAGAAESEWRRQRFAEYLGLERA